MVRAKRSLVIKKEDWLIEIGSFECTIVCRPSMSLNNENNCRETGEDKIAACEKTTGSMERELSGFELSMHVRKC